MSMASGQHGGCGLRERGGVVTGVELPQSPWTGCGRGRAAGGLGGGAAACPQEWTWVLFWPLPLQGHTVLAVPGVCRAAAVMACEARLWEVSSSEGLQGRGAAERGGRGRAERGPDPGAEAVWCGGRTQAWRGMRRAGRTVSASFLKQGLQRKGWPLCWVLLSRERRTGGRTAIRFSITDILGGLPAGTGQRELQMRVGRLCTEGRHDSLSWHPVRRLE